MSTLTHPERDAAIRVFLEEAGWGNATRVSLGEDASTRRYERLHKGDQTAILMDAPPAAESQPCDETASFQDRIRAGWNGRTRLAASRVDAFVGIGNYLTSLGLSAPQVLAFDVEQGLALLEDLGDGVYASEIARGECEETLYAAAIDALAHVHNTPPPDKVTAGQWTWPILGYDKLALTTGADLFPKWYPAFDSSVSFHGRLARDFSDEVSNLSRHLAALPQVLMLRDYHAENLLWLPEREGLKKVGILDFQDAVRGPAAWDLAMFLQDARRDVTPAIRQMMFRRYLDLTGNTEAKFRRDYAIAGAINALRIIGVFARLVSRDKKPKYKAFLPREWGHLNDSLRHEELTKLRDILRRAAPLQIMEA